MSQTAHAVVLAVFVLAVSVWVGGYVAIGVVARAARATLRPADRVAFFRALGRSYLGVGVAALAIALAAGAVLVRGHERDPLLVLTAALAVALVALLAVAVVQARRMTRLRRRALEAGADAHLDAQVRRGSRAAGALRAILGLLTVSLVVLGAFLAT
ncbi:hypothetical protein [Nocardioides soli]|uniref:Putative membrane protein n=1 Tax=Nocardioides soli TaxID=1036020 RepID=A0A7W4Z2W2_9ACTN|nr:hypothetical protein [Nocardioides soli]MBB3043040.1 putative membrane protein [Nocardioides soli]